MKLRPFARLLATTVASIVLGVAAPASAQYGAQATFGDAFVADFLNRDMPLLADTLDLEDWQMDVVEALLDRYTTKFTAGVEDVREEMKNVKNLIGKGDNRQVMDHVMKPVRAWTEQKRLLKDEFINDVKSQLSASQLEQWPRFEMAFRREKLLPRGEISGEAVDLFTIIREMQLDPAIEESLEPALNQYETDVDGALQAREQEVVATTSAMADAMRDGQYGEMVRINEQIMTKRVALRGIQESNAATIAAAMPESLGAEFLLRFKQKAFPKAYREPILQVVFDAAKKLTDLTEEQLAEVITLESSYRAENELVNDQIATVIKATEPNEPKRKLEMSERKRAKQPEPQPADDPMKAALEKRDALAKRTLEQLKAILTPEQFEKLPKVSFIKSGEHTAKSRAVSAATRDRANRAKAAANRAMQPVGLNDPSLRVPVSPNGRGGNAGKAVSPSTRMKNMKKAQKGELMGSGMPSERGGGKGGAPKQKGQPKGGGQATGGSH